MRDPRTTPLFWTTRLTVAAVAYVLCGTLSSTMVCIAATAASTGQDSGRAERAAGAPAAKPRLDRSGRKRVGKASYYAAKFSGKTMANGEKMQPHGDNAASKTLPLGTTAKVTNLQTGQSAVVTIQDRGPYAKDRILDVSPATARQIGIDRTSGLATVEVAPIAVPLPDGSVRAGVTGVAQPKR